MFEFLRIMPVIRSTLNDELTGSIQLLDNFARISSTIREDSLSNPPLNLKIRREKKSLLVIFKDDTILGDLIALFPFTYYQIEGLVSPTISIVYNEQHTILDLVREVDKILLLGYEPDSFSKELDIDAHRIVFCEQQFVPNLGKVHIVHFGENNPDVQFFMKLPNRLAGLFWNILSYVGFKEHFPMFQHFVDMENYPNQHVPTEDLGRYNPWDYYIAPWSRYSLDDIYNSSKVIFYNGSKNYTSTNISRSFFSKIILDKFEKMRNSLFGNKEKILGIFLRGSDHVYAPWHTVPYDGYEAEEIVNQYLSAYGLEYVFLDTEDQDNYQIFKKKFGDKLLAIDRPRFSKEDLLPHAKADYKGFYGLDVGTSYILETLLLAESDGILMAGGSASLVIPNLCAKKDGYLFIKSSLSKGFCGVSGTHPIYVENYNKNYLGLQNNDLIDSGLRITTNNQHVSINGKIDFHRAFKLSNTETCLLPGTSYVGSVAVLRNSTNVPDCVFVLEDLSGHIYKFKPGDTMIFRDIVYNVSIEVVVDAGHYDCEFGFQIEKGMFITEYEEQYHSAVEIAIKDFGGLYYKFDYLKILDFATGMLVVGDKTLRYNFEELQKFNDRITYPSGHTLFRINGKCFGSLTFNRKIINVTDDELLDLDWMTSIPDTPMATFTKVKVLQSLLLSDSVNCQKVAFAEIKESCSYSPKYNYLLYLAYSRGLGASKNMPMAIDHLKKSVAVYSYQCTELFDVLWNQNTAEYDIEAVRIAEIYASKGNGSIKGRLSHAYRDGRGVIKDIGKAIDILRDTIKTNNEWSNELFDLLWGLKTKKADKEAFIVARDYANYGNQGAKGRLALTYIYGRGVKKDQFYAASLLRDVIKTNSEWVKEFINLLWNIGTTESKREAIETAQVFASKGNNEAKHFLKGIEQKNIV